MVQMIVLKAKTYHTVVHFAGSFIQYRQIQFLVCLIQEQHGGIVAFERDMHDGVRNVQAAPTSHLSSLITGFISINV